jgi:N-acetylmuramoyl-L-alanine amidase
MSSKMKNITKIGIVTNAVIAAAMLNIYCNKISNDQLELIQAEVIAQEVANQMHKANELQCLAINIYHEARSEGLTGQRAVAWATMNRVSSDAYPDTVCEVVYQAKLTDAGTPIQNKCQFSWYCDGKSDDIENETAWNEAVTIAEEVMYNYGIETDPTNGAIMYHAAYVEPYWASSYEKTARIDTHVFYN